MDINEFAKLAYEEDNGPENKDHSTLACIPENETGRAVLKIKEDGVLAGMDVAQSLFHYLEPGATFNLMMEDGQDMKTGMQAFEVTAKVHTILKAERIVLNMMQRMSGIATLTRAYADLIIGTKSRLLDTRKTTPLIRYFEKEAVRIGGGYNHRMGLYDMIMLKDNHIDYCGGIEQAILKSQQYLKDNHLDIPIEVETRNIEDVRKVLSIGGIQRIMLDNYTPDQMKEAVDLIGGRCETEASGGINTETIRTYAETGVDFISVGALTHQARSLDLSLKAISCG